MKLTISAPHVINGIQVKNRISPNYITLKVLPANDEYHEYQKTFFLKGNLKRIKENTLNPQGNKNKFLVKGSDVHRSSFSQIEFQGNLYEPVIIQCWLPSNDIFNNLINTITNTSYLRKVEVGEVKTQKNSPIAQIAREWAFEYNDLINQKIQLQKKYDKLTKDMEFYEDLTEMLGLEKLLNSF